MKIKKVKKGEENFKNAESSFIINDLEVKELVH